MGFYFLAPLPFIGFLAAVDFAHTITLGSVILGVIISIATVVTLMYGVKYKSLAAQQEKVIETLQAGQEAWKETAERHEEEKKGILDLVTQQKQVISDLQALPNLAIILDKMSEEATRQDETGKVRIKLALDQLREMNEDLWAQHEAHANRRANELASDLGKIIRDTNTKITEVLREVKE